MRKICPLHKFPKHCELLRLHPIAALTLGSFQHDQSRDSLVFIREPIHPDLTALAELRRFRFDHQQLVFEYLKRTVDQTEERVTTLDQTIEYALPDWHFAPVVDALRALRGVNTTVAATVVAEIGDIIRIENPCQLMAWLGLVPSEHSSGNTTRRGRLTKTGNTLARTMLVEAGRSYLAAVLDWFTRRVLSWRVSITLEADF